MPMASAAVSMNWAGTSQAINPGTLSITGWSAAKTTALGRKLPMPGACGGYWKSISGFCRKSSVIPIYWAGTPMRRQNLSITPCSWGSPFMGQ